MPLLTRLSLAGTAIALLAASGCGSGSTTTAPPAPLPTSTPASSTAAPPAGHTPSTPSGAGTTSAAPTTTAPSTPEPPHATEFNPPGDIPDNAVFVDHTAPGTQVHVSVPEGWAQSTVQGVTTFTDKYNSVSIEVRPMKQASTVASIKADDVPGLQATEPNVMVEDLTSVTRQHGSALLLRYLKDSAPDPVTDKVVRDEVLRFSFWSAGQEAILSLTGPQNADNVDPWQIVSDSLHFG